MGLTFRGRGWAPYPTLGCIALLLRLRTCAERERWMRSAFRFSSAARGAQPGENRRAADGSRRYASACAALAPASAGGEEVFSGDFPLRCFGRLVSTFKK